jgi:hypothetical protein
MIKPKAHILRPIRLVGMPSSRGNDVEQVIGAFTTPNSDGYYGIGVNIETNSTGDHFQWRVIRHSDDRRFIMFQNVGIAAFSGKSCLSTRSNAPSLDECDPNDWCVVWSVHQNYLNDSDCTMIINVGESRGDPSNGSIFLLTRRKDMGAYITNNPLHNFLLDNSACWRRQVL